MVLAAGVGSRLRPLTDKTPKALLEVGGVTLLERTIVNLVNAGVDGVIVNTFHLAEAVEALLRSKDFGVQIEVSREETLLETGGGIKNASWFLNDGRPFLVHNVDVLTDLDLAELYRAHLRTGALATLAVRERPGGRRLVFDSGGRLVCREGEAAAPPRGVALAFDGVHVLSPRVFEKLTESGAFSITDAYLRLAAGGEDIRAFRSDVTCWADAGTPERLEEARRRFTDAPTLVRPSPWVAVSLSVFMALAMAFDMGMHWMVLRPLAMRWGQPAQGLVTMKLKHETVVINYQYAPADAPRVDVRVSGARYKRLSKDDTVAIHFIRGCPSCVALDDDPGVASHLARNALFILATGLAMFWGMRVIGRLIRRLAAAQGIFLGS